MEIVNTKHNILHRKLVAVESFTPEIKTLIDDMRKTMIEAKGIGLAANQVGIDLQIFVIDKKLADEHGVPDTYINPKITEYSKDTIPMEEGCLSIPQYWTSVTRAKKIKLKALDEHGGKIKLKARGLLARVLQHEFDHLQGILIRDKVES